MIDVELVLKSLSVWGVHIGPLQANKNMYLSYILSMLAILWSKAILSKNQRITEVHFVELVEYLHVIKDIHVEFLSKLHLKV